MTQRKSKNALIVTALTGFVRAFLLDDIKILQELGYKVYCMANVSGDDLSQMENVEYFKKIGVSFFNVSFSSSDPLSKDNIKAYNSVCKCLKDNQYDLIHVHTPIPGVLVRFAARKYRKSTKIIYTTHGFYFHKYSSKKNWVVFRTIEDMMSHYCDAIITINKEDYRNALKMHCKNVFYINGVGVNTSKFIDCEIDREDMRNKLGVTEDNVVIMSVGELSKRKNHQVIIRAMHELGNDNLVYLICGKIVEGQGTYHQLMELAKELNVDVRLLGYRTDIPEISRAADIGAIPSSREGLGLAGIEMLAAGLPLVASNVHGMVDYAIDGVTGFTAKPYDVHGYAECLAKLADSKTRMKMKCACVQKAKEFDITKSHLQRESIYKKILCGDDL